MEHAKSGPVGLGGWLLLPMIGMALSPILMLRSLFSEIMPIFQDGTFDAVTTPSHPAYHHLWAPLIYMEVIGNAVLIVLALTALVLIAIKSRLARRFAIIWFAAAAGFTTVDFFASDMIPALADVDDTESLKIMVRACFSACIWIPYFLVSKRVKATFVR